MIEMREKKLSNKPVFLSEVIEHFKQLRSQTNNQEEAKDRLLQDWQYRKVKCVGTFDYSREIRLGPRPPPMDTSNVMKRDGERGYFFITPFLTKDAAGNDVELLVNRGWISDAAWKENPVSPREKVNKNGSSEVAAEGVLHAGEKKPPGLDVDYVPANGPGWIWIDVARMMKTMKIEDKAGTLPYVLDMFAPRPPGRYPVRKNKGDFISFYTTPIVHVAYAFTWGSLSIGALVVLYIRFKKDKRQAAWQVYNMQQMNKGTFPKI